MEGGGEDGLVNLLEYYPGTASVKCLGTRTQGRKQRAEKILYSIQLLKEGLRLDRGSWVLEPRRSVRE